MGDNEELKQELQEQLEWVQYRQSMLDIMEAKILQMKLLAEQAKEAKLNPGETEVLNARLNNLASQVNAIDSESRIIEDGKIIE